MATGTGKELPTKVGWYHINGKTPVTLFDGKKFHTAEKVRYWFGPVELKDPDVFQLMHDWDEDTRLTITGV